jgi:hypothetical protein
MCQGEVVAGGYGHVDIANANHGPAASLAQMCEPVYGGVPLQRINGYVQYQCGISLMHHSLPLNIFFIDLARKL